MEETKSVSVEEPQDGLTDAQRKHLKKLEERVSGHGRRRGEWCLVASGGMGWNSCGEGAGLVWCLWW